MTVLPRSAGTFLMSRSEISLKDAAVSRMLVISPADTPSSPSRCRCVNAMLTSSPFDHDLVHRLADGLREEHAARADADQRETVGALVVLEDLVGDADEGPLDAECVHHLAGAVGAHQRPPDTKKPPRLSREACSGATENVGVMHEPFLTSLGQVKRRRTVFGSRS